MPQAKIPLSGFEFALYLWKGGRVSYHHTSRLKKIIRYSDLCDSIVSQKRMIDLRLDGERKEKRSVKKALLFERSEFRAFSWTTTGSPTRAVVLIFSLGYFFCIKAKEIPCFYQAFHRKAEKRRCRVADGQPLRGWYFLGVGGRVSTNRFRPKGLKEKGSMESWQMTVYRRRLCKNAFRL